MDSDHFEPQLKAFIRGFAACGIAPADIYKSAKIEFATCQNDDSIIRAMWSEGVFVEAENIPLVRVDMVAVGSLMDTV